MIACKLIVQLPPEKPLPDDMWDVWKQAAADVRSRHAPAPNPPIVWSTIMNGDPRPCYYCTHTIPLGATCNYAKGYGISHRNCYEDHK